MASEKIEAVPFVAPRRALFAAIGLMCLIVALANALVRYPINDWLTWGAFTYPLSYLVADIVNRRFGVREARQVVWYGFALAVPLSILVASPRVAMASCLAYILSQLLNVSIFDRLRAARWWQAPAISTSVGTATDALLFWVFAFGGTDEPWLTWASGDIALKWFYSAALLAPFRWLLYRRLGLS